MKVKGILIIFSLCFLLTGCIVNPYHNPKFGEDAIDAWFSYSEDNLGETRKSLENIKEIISKSCVYLEDNGSIYIYKCEVVYQPIGETVIPLSRNKTISLYVAFKPDGDSYTYRVYSSSSKNGVWKLDDDLNY